MPTSDQLPDLKDALVIGSGFGGMIAVRALRALGLQNIQVLERRSFLGGTWLQNRYPGAQVDVQSPLYSLSGEPWDWSRLFAMQDELEAYTEHLLETYGLRAITALEAEVIRLTWDGEAWRAHCRDGRVFRARFVVSASGGLSQPNVPELPDRDAFRGPTWHTNGWRHDVPITGRRVAVIGSGASAAQVIPAIAPQVEHLHVFQRTPHWVMPRPDRALAGWQRALLRQSWVYTTLRRLIYWRLESRVLAFKYSSWLLDLLGTRKGLRHLAREVPDPELRAKLTPDYQMGCKRVIVSNTLYPALQRSNVTLHDRDDAVVRFTEEGVETAQGTHIPLDAVVYATGYTATDGQIPFEVVGEAGTLAERWAEFPRAYLGTTVPGFPNLFLVGGPNTGIGHTSALFVMEAQMSYIQACIRAARNGAVAVRPEAEARYTEWVHRAMQGTVWQAGGCRSWYHGQSGRVIAIFPGFSFTFRRWCARFRPADHITS